MACNCKKKIALEEKYGIMEEESLFGKVYRYSFRIFLFVLLLLLSVIIVPILVVIIIYQFIFKGEEKIIVLPHFLGKYLE